MEKIQYKCYINKKLLKNKDMIHFNSSKSIKTAKFIKIL